jgi:hypothetical protein
MKRRVVASPERPSNSAADDATMRAAADAGAIAVQGRNERRTRRPRFAAVSSPLPERDQRALLVCECGVELALEAGGDGLLHEAIEQRRV